MFYLVLSKGLFSPFAVINYRTPIFAIKFKPNLNVVAVAFFLRRDIPTLQVIVMYDILVNINDFTGNFSWCDIPVHRLSVCCSLVITLDCSLKFISNKVNSFLYL